MSMFHISEARAVELLAAAVQNEIKDRVKIEIMKYVTPIVEDAALSIAKQIRSRLDSVHDPMRMTTRVVVNFDGIQKVEL